jgi:hypothetical protein
MCHSDSMCLFLTRLRYASPRYANKLPVKKTTIFNPNNTIYYLHIFCVVLDNFFSLIIFPNVISVAHSTFELKLWHFCSHAKVQRKTELVFHKWSEDPRVLIF